MNSSSSSRAVLHRYTMRNQATSAASAGSNRQSMLIGTTNDEQGLWVSFDKRGNSYHPRYWNDASKSQSLVNLKGKVNFAKGLELSQFSSKKRANRQKPHQDKQKLLIRQVYHQGGVLHEGDLENVEAQQAEKDKQGMLRRKLKLARSGKVKHVAQKKALRPLGQYFMKFSTDAGSLPQTIEFAKELQGEMRKHVDCLPPPPNVLREAVIQAHANHFKNGFLTHPYLQWLLANERQTTLSKDGDDEDSGGQDEDDEDDEEDEDDEDDEDGEDDGDGEDGEDGEEGEEDGEGEDEDIEEDEGRYEPEFEDEETIDERAEESLGVERTKDDSDVGAHRDARGVDSDARGVDSDAGFGLEGIPENPRTSSKRRRWGYLEAESPEMTFEMARQSLFYHYNIKD